LPEAWGALRVGSIRQITTNRRESLVCRASGRRALAQLGRESIELRDAAQLAVSFLPRVYRQSILDERRRAITLELLDQIGSRTGGVQMIHAIRRAVPRVFGLDVIGAEAAAPAIDGWLKSRTIQEVIKV
jgi:hypothetical protein